MRRDISFQMGTVKYHFPDVNPQKDVRSVIFKMMELVSNASQTTLCTKAGVKGNAKLKLAAANSVMKKTIQSAETATLDIV